jgi:diphthamide synthase (EF-2-diphthine--ammonia ligase)
MSITSPRQHAATIRKLAQLPLDQLYRMLDAAFSKMEAANEHVLTSLAVVRRINYLWTELESRHVQEARRQGFSWAIIAAHTEVSKQGAQQRWSSRSVDATLAAGQDFDPRQRDTFSGKPKE